MYIMIKYLPVVSTVNTNNNYNINTNQLVDGYIIWPRLQNNCYYTHSLSTE